MSRTFSFNTAHVAERKVRDEYVLVPVSSAYGQHNTLFDLNPTAARIWEHAKAGVCETDICSRLAEEFDAPADEISGDVKTVLDELVAFGALQPVETET